MRKNRINFGRILAGVSMMVVVAAVAANAAAKSATPPIPAPAVDNKLAPSPGEETAVLAGGCFWGVEAVYQHVKGVKVVVSGFAGGKEYAEAVRIVFDPSVISYGQILRVFFAVAHDPTQLNRQGPDIGPQYRSEIFAQDNSQRRIADAYIAQLQQAGSFDKPIVTLVSGSAPFKVAPAFHQSYVKLHPTEPYVVINDIPKLEHLREQFPALYK